MAGRGVVRRPFQRGVARCRLVFTSKGGASTPSHGPYYSHSSWRIKSEALAWWSVLRWGRRQALVYNTSKRLEAVCGKAGTNHHPDDFGTSSEHGMNTVCARLASLWHRFGARYVRLWHCFGMLAPTLGSPLRLHFCSCRPWRSRRKCKPDQRIAMRHGSEQGLSGPPFFVGRRNPGGRSVGPRHQTHGADAPRSPG